MAETFKDALNRGDINTLADALRILRFGTILRGLITALRKSTVAASPYIAATAAAVVKQAEDAPAARITAAYARVGGVTGVLAVVATNPPATGEISIAPNGDIQTLAADAITDLDVQYEPHIGEVVETVQQVSANVLTLPPFITDRGAVVMLECEALAGTVTGAKIIDAPGTAPAATHAALNAAKATVAFNAADAVTSARVKLLVASAADVSALLTAASPVL